MRSFCLLMSMELIRTPNSNLFYLHSRDMNNLNSLFLGESYSYKYIIVIKYFLKTHSSCIRLEWNMEALLSHPPLLLVLTVGCHWFQMKSRRYLAQNKMTLTADARYIFG